MASSRIAEREEERRFNLRTLAIASAASATAAVVTSQLWIAGTWIAAAMTPVIVALVSELLHRPTERIAGRVTSDRTALRGERIAADRSASGPVRVYRTAPPPRRRRRLALGAVLVTGVLALLIAVVGLTVTELIAGGAIGNSDGRTTFVRGDRDTSSEQREQPSSTGQDGRDRPEETRPSTETVTETTTTDPPPEEETTPTAPTEEPPPTDTAPVPAEP